MTSFSAPRGQPESRRDEGAPLSGRPPRQSGRLHARDDVTIAFQRRTWVNNRYRSRPVGRQTCHGSPAHPRACASLAVDRPVGPSLPQCANVSPSFPASSTQLRLGAKPPTVAGSRTDDKVEGNGPRRMPSVIKTHATRLRPLSPIRFSPDRKRTHSPCYIPTTKSGAAPHRPPPQFPSPK
jgi:hypothetical protein